jgi:hypothetical protein
MTTSRRLVAVQQQVGEQEARGGEWRLEGRSATASTATPRRHVEPAGGGTTHVTVSVNLSYVSYLLPIGIELHDVDFFV